VSTARRRAAELRPWVDATAVTVAGTLGPVTSGGLCAANDDGKATARRGGLLSAQLTLAAPM
jgi:hypothetical protein